MTCLPIGNQPYFIHKKTTMNNPNKKPLFLILLLLSLLNFDLTAQVKDDKIKSWEVGADLLWLIDKNQLPTSVFVRSNYVTKKNKLRAWRLRLGMDLSINDSSQIGDPLDNKLKQTYILIRVGHEWKYRLEEKVMFYFGGDFQFSYNHTYEKRILTLLPPPGSLYQETLKLYEPGLVGFVGVKFVPRPWIAFSIESSLNIIYRIRREDFKTTSINFPDDEGFYGFIHVNELNINITPITVINISFNINL